MPGPMRAPIFSGFTPMAVICRAALPAMPSAVPFEKEKPVAGPWALAIFDHMNSIAMFLVHQYVFLKRECRDSVLQPSFLKRRIARPRDETMKNTVSL